MFQNKKHLPLELDGVKPKTACKRTRRVVSRLTYHYFEFEISLPRGQQCLAATEKRQSLRYKHV